MIPFPLKRCVGTGNSTHVWFLSLASPFLLSKHIRSASFISWALCGSTPNCWINRLEVKQKKSTNTHRGIITRNVFKLKTLLTRKKLYREKFKLFSVFPSEIFSYRVDISIVQKKLFKQKIKVWIHSKRRHKRGPEGFKAPNVDQRKRTPSRGSHDHWGLLGQGTPKHQGPPHCHLSAPSRRDWKSTWSCHLCYTTMKLSLQWAFTDPCWLHGDI